MKRIHQLSFVLLTLFWSTALASAIPGRAEVKKIIGKASLINATGATSSLAEGMVLGSGDTVSTGPGSTVDLWLGLNGDALRIDPETTLKLDVLDIANISERRVTTSMSLGKGAVTGEVITKLTAASRYEIKTSTGVAGVRGTIYKLSANGKLVVLKGTVVFMEPSGRVITVSEGKTLEAGSATPRDSTPDEQKEARDSNPTVTPENKNTVSPNPTETENPKTNSPS